VGSGFGDGRSGPAGKPKTEEFEMRKLLSLVAAGVILFSLAGAAEARIIAFDGTLDLALGTLPPIRATGGGAITLNSSGGLGHLSTMQIVTPSLVYGSATVTLTDPDLSPLLSIRGTAALQTGTLSPISGGGPLVNGQLGVAGIFKLCILFNNCSSFIPVPLTENGTRGMGLGGIITINGFGGAGIKISAVGAPWTIQTAAISIPTANGNFTTITTRHGFAHGPASLTSSTANVSGVVQLVTPVVVDSTIAGRTALFGILTLHFVPEPGTFLLFGAGVVALGVAGRRRVKKH
jgi:hypothetical protein